MNRCTCLAPSLSRSARSGPTAGLLGLALSFFAGLALAQTPPVTPHVRNFPAGVQRAEMVVVQPPLITLNGKQDTLSMGSRIRDANNHLVLSAQIVNQKVVVNYLRENGGPVHQVWILNAEEAKIRLPGMKRSFFDALSGEPESDEAAAATPSR